MKNIHKLNNAMSQIIFAQTTKYKYNTIYPILNKFRIIYTQSNDNSTVCDLKLFKLLPMVISECIIMEIVIYR